MKKTAITVLLLYSFLNLSAQQKKQDNVFLNVDLSPLKELPTKILIEKTDLGKYTVKTDTCNVKGKIFTYRSRMLEPALFNVIFYWPGRKITSILFWALPSKYSITVDKDLKPELSDNSHSDFVMKAASMDRKVTHQRMHLDSLLKNVSYENKKIADVETRINVLRDSVENEVDENIYRKCILENLNSPIALYALCMYAERPYENQRVKSQPEKIQELFNRLHPDIQKMPSAVILHHKLNLGKQMVPGKMLADISLQDTVGNMIKISDFKGKYVLIDFWASWCMPCREENPALIRAYNKFRNIGFQVIGITTDQMRSKQDWLKAIKQDHTNLWPQLSDFDEKAQRAYGIRFIPANYLIDPNGVIIARDLRGEEIEKELEKHLNVNNLPPK